MGFLSRLFNKDPEIELQQLELALSQDDHAGVIKGIKKLQARLEGEQRQRADALLQQAESQALKSCLEKAERSRNAGHNRDAAAWLEIALEHTTDPTQREEFLAQIEFLQMEQNGKVFGQGGVSGNEQESPHMELELEDHFHMLVGMLNDDITSLYEAKPLEFRQAYVQLNSNRVEEAKQILVHLVETNPEDAVYQLEYARCLALTGEQEEACRYLERVWSTFGDEALDAAGGLSIPLLWGNAKLARNDCNAILDRLAELAQPERKNPNLALIYGAALEMAEDYEQALSFYINAGKKFGGSSFSFRVAEMLQALERWEEAKSLLESTVLPSCSTGNCAQGPIHLPSLRSLIALYLKLNAPMERIHDLLLHLDHAANGHLSSVDHMLLATYYDRAGDKTTSEEHLQLAEEIRSRGPQQHDNLAGISQSTGMDKAVL